MGPEATTLADGTVVLRPWVLEDAPRVAEICADPEIPRWTTLPFPYTLEHARTWLRQVVADRGRGAGEAAFAVTDPTSGAVVGAIGLRPEAGKATIGYWVAAEARGRGVATAALELVCHWALHELGIARLELVTDPANVASQRVAEKAGFQREGLLRRHLEVRGERRDCILYTRRAGALETADAGTRET